MELTDATSRRWIEHLQPGQRDRDRTVRALHEVLHRAAIHELSRRRHRLSSISGPEFDDLAQQAADDALVTILSKLATFRGRSRFTTWAYSFVVFEVSGKLARHWWRRELPHATDANDDGIWDVTAAQPDVRVDQFAQFAALASAIDELTPRQRQAFVAIALNDVPIDVVALRLGTNRNAVYKTLFDARRNLRRKLAAAGLAVNDADDGGIPASGNARTATARG